VVKEIAQKQLVNDKWLRRMGQLGHRSYEQMRVTIHEFLNEEIFNLSPRNCVALLQPIIQSWDIDLTTFGMDIILNHRVARGHVKKFEYVETESATSVKEEPGLAEFLQSPSLSRGATEEEIEFLKKLRFNGKRPTALYYYRELQNLRDPLHFHSS
jgi:hypothetical protein